jgi:hypothetical protein
MRSNTLRIVALILLGACGLSSCGSSGGSPMMSNVSNTLVQSAKSTVASETSGGSLANSATFSSATTAGNLLIAVASWANPSALTVPTVTMSTPGVTWNAVAQAGPYSGNQGYINIYYAFNAPSVSSSTSNTFTLGSTGNDLYSMLTIYEFAGLGAGSLDTQVSSDGNTTTPNPGSIAVAGAGELIIATANMGPEIASYTNPAGNSSFTAGQLSAATNVTFTGGYVSEVDEYLLSSASGANATTYGAASETVLWIGQAVAFKPGDP